LRHSAIILSPPAWRCRPGRLGELSLLRATAVFACIGAAAAGASAIAHVAGLARGRPRRQPGRDPPPSAAIVAGMPDHGGSARPRRPRSFTSDAAAAQLAPGAAQERTRAVRACARPKSSPALREAIATTEARRATYLDHVPRSIDGWN